MRKEIRKILAVWLMTLVLWIMPECEFKVSYCKFLEKNIMKL